MPRIDDSQTTELPGFIHFGRAICCDLEQASRREWWLANGLGGYAGGTIAQCLTRRYHGLLIASAHPPWSGFWFSPRPTLHCMTISAAGRCLPIAGAAVQSEPRGLIHLESFRLDGSIPVWRFVSAILIVEQCIWMERKQPTTCVAWRLAHAVERPVHLGIDLLVNSRDHHGESRSGEFNPAIDGNENHISIRHPGGPVLHFHTDDGHLSARHQWIEDFDLPRERERGLPDRDSHLCAVHMRLPLRNEWSGLIATVATPLTDDTRPRCAELLQHRRAHDTARLTAAAALTPELRDAPCWIRQLVVAADSFLIARPVVGTGRAARTGRTGEYPQQHGESIIAGYLGSATGDAMR